MIGVGEFVHEPVLLRELLTILMVVPLLIRLIQPLLVLMTVPLLEGELGHEAAVLVLIVLLKIVEHCRL